MGNHYVIHDAGYNAAIGVGQSATFGFVATRVGASTDPTGYVLNGTASGSPPPPAPTDLAASARYRMTNDWGTGFTGEVALTNLGTAALGGWTFEFDFAANITQVWGATIVSHVGNHYVLKDAGYNAAIGAGQTISFGFVAARADNTSGPAIAVFTDATLTNGTRKKKFATVGPAT